MLTPHEAEGWQRPAVAQEMRYHMANEKYARKLVRENFPKANRSGKNPSTNTLELYKKHAIQFADWAANHYKFRSFSKMGNFLQAYCDDLVKQGKSPSTIHTYMAACCHTWGIPMGDIRKPKRHSCENTRSRGTKPVHKRSDSQPERSPRLVELASMVGIRRSEYKKLKKCNLQLDESGELCVEVIKGKGGKYQLQRVLPQHQDLVRTFFDDTGAFVFTKEEMKNKIDLHRIRGQVARNAYEYYRQRLATEPDYAAQLEEEIRLRWCKYKKTKDGEPVPWDPKCVLGSYAVRGGNRELALDYGISPQFSRLIVMAVSVFHLSHWRCDVTVANYLLAV